MSQASWNVVVIVINRQRHTFFRLVREEHLNACGRNWESKVNSCNDVNETCYVARIDILVRSFDEIEIIAIRNDVLVCVLAGSNFGIL